MYEIKLFDWNDQVYVHYLGKVSRTYGHLHNFVEMEMSNEYVKQFSSFFKIKSEDLPIVYIIDTDEKKKTKGQMSSTKDLTEKGKQKMGKF